MVSKSVKNIDYLRGMSNLFHMKSKNLSNGLAKKIYKPFFYISYHFTNSEHPVRMIYMSKLLRKKMDFFVHY